MTTTALFCTIAMIVIAIYDGIAVSIGGVNNSISRWFQNTAFASPCFVFAFGFIAGHLFGYLKPETNVAAMLQPLSFGSFVLTLVLGIFAMVGLFSIAVKIDRFLQL